MSSKIELLIDEIEEYIESCKFQPLSNTKIVVNKEEIETLIHELRTKTPEEIKRYQKIIVNKEAILNDARQKAEQLINEATIQTNELINEHEIMLQAYEQANEIVSLASNQAQEILDAASLEANAMKSSAVQYTDDLLAHVEEVLVHYIQNATVKYDEMIRTLNECYEVVKANRAELVPPEIPEEEVEEAVQANAGNTLNSDDMISLDLL